MTAIMLGLGTAVPERSISQGHAARLAAGLIPPGPPGRESDAADTRVLEALYRRSGIRERGSVLIDVDAPDGVPAQSFFAAPRHSTDRGPGTAARVARYAIEAPRLAERAARAAIAESGLEPRTFTHIVTASCTGFSAPGVDAALIAALGLRPTAERTHVGFMGCHGAINALRVARAYAEADPAARVLVVAVEVCSLHYHYTADPERVVANALFADGAAAVVVAGAGTGQPATNPLTVAACGSCLVPASADAMTWTIGDRGFEMTLSPRVPEFIGRHLAPWLRTWLDGLGLSAGEVGGWAIHPGGPRVITAAVEALGLDPRHADASRAVLADHGNMSSPTVLFILDRLRRAGAARPICVLAFGPGLVVEAALLR